MFQLIRRVWSRPEKDPNTDSADLATLLLREMKQYHYDYDVQTKAERKYDYDKVFNLLTEMVEQVYVTSLLIT